MVMTGSEEGLSPAWAKDQEVTYSPSSGSGRPPTTHAYAEPSGSWHQAIVSLGNPPTMPCFGILGQKAHTPIGEGPGSGQV